MGDLDGGSTSVSATASTSGAATSTSSATSSSDATSTSGGESTSGDSSGPSDWPGCGFICSPDGGVAPACDLWAQDCPPGEKCMPRAAEGEFDWSETVCSPIVDDPAEPGDPCTAEGSGASGIDDCVAGAMCWDVDPETNAGTCVALCLGSALNPTCEDPRTQCEIFNEGFLILCLPPCDPTVQDCDDGYKCIPDAEAFVCTYANQHDNVLGDPCTLPNDCDPGQFCADASAVPDCLADRCCSALCDLDAPDPDVDCTLDGQICVPWYAPGMAPPGLAHVGACTLP